MIVVRESAPSYKSNKPVVCPKCGSGKLGFIPEQSMAVVSRRGSPPMNERGDCVQVKCPVCRKLWALTIE